MAVMKGLRIVRGKLGDNGFRQQYVKDGAGGYKKRTVMFQLPEGNTSNSVGQARQRSRFRLIQAIATILANFGLLKVLYRSVPGLSGYNSFIQYNIKNAIAESEGDFFVNFPKLRVANGDWYKEIQVFQSDVTPDDPECEFTRKVAWNYEYLKDPKNAHDYYLVVMGLKINEEGALEEAFVEQPLHRMTECSADITLKECDCCKTYYFAFFVNPTTGYNTTSQYIGTSMTEVPELDDSCCLVCDAFDTPVRSTPPGEGIEQCCGGAEVDKNNIFFNGTLAAGSRGNAVAEPCFVEIAGSSAGDTACTVLTPYVENNSLYSGTLDTLPLSVDSDGTIQLIQPSGFTVESDVLSTYPNTATLLDDLNAKISATGSNAVISSLIFNADGTIGKTIEDLDIKISNPNWLNEKDVEVAVIAADGTELVVVDVKFDSIVRKATWFWGSQLTGIANQTVGTDAGVVYTGPDQSLLSHIVYDSTVSAGSPPTTLNGQTEDADAACPNQDFNFALANSGTFEAVAV